MDLMNLKPTSDVVEVTLTHPSTSEVLKNEDGTAMTITMYASHSKEYKVIVHEQTNKRLKLAQAKIKTELTSELIEEASLDLLSSATKSWNITYGKKIPELTRELAKVVYQDVFWIKDQIEEAVADSLDFT